MLSTRCTSSVSSAPELALLATAEGAADAEEVTTRLRTPKKAALRAIAPKFMGSCTRSNAATMGNPLPGARSEAECSARHADHRLGCTWRASKSPQLLCEREGVGGTAKGERARSGVVWEGAGGLAALAWDPRGVKQHSRERNSAKGALTGAHGLQNWKQHQQRTSPPSEAAKGCIQARRLGGSVPRSSDPGASGP